MLFKRLKKMAYRVKNDGQGYDERRFEDPVRPDVLCSICQDVLRNPKACQNKEHPFCYACIIQHLENSHTCPECREDLTPETLKNPPRFLLSYLADLKINCDHNSRGCPDYVRLENLQYHVDQCKFAPVLCQLCGMVVCKIDKDKECKEHQNPIAPKSDAISSRDKCTENTDIKRNQEKMKYDIDRVKGSQDQLKAKQDQFNKDLSGITVKLVGVERKQDELNAKVMELKGNVDEIKRTQAEMKAEMKQEFQRVVGMLHMLLPAANLGGGAFTNYLANNEPEIIIMGGWNSPGRDTILNSVEIYNIARGKSELLPPMNHPRVEAASCVFNKDVIVSGGYDGGVCTDNIEILKMDQHPLQWTIFEGKLPAKLSSHSLIVYQDKLLVIGGMNKSENKTSNAIYELLVIPPYSFKRLFKMPQATRNHGAELVDDKVFVLGGTQTGLSQDAMDSVTSYDCATNGRKRCEALPYCVCGMSTVTWGSMIIVIGGTDKKGHVLNDVIMYETVTGRTEKLPSMIYRRYGSSAVIMDEIVYVIGGWNQQYGYLSSIECLTIGNDFWVELPHMRESRRLPTAVVKPRH